MIQLTDAQATGAAAAVQAALVGIHNTYGDQAIVAGIAQYVLIGGEERPREQWNEFVARLRDVYFQTVGIKDS